MANVSVTTQTLDLLHVGVARMIPQRLLEHGIGGRWDVSSRLAFETDALILQVTGYLAADHIETVHITHPLNWIEAIKQRWAPKWVIARWPVIEKIHTVRLDAAYPKMPLPAQYGNYIRIQRYDHSVSTFNEGN